MEPSSSLHPIFTPFMAASFRYRNSNLPGLILLLIAIVIGLLTYKDYGIAWDENIQRALGRINYEYIFDGNNYLEHYEDRAYGAWFELLLIQGEKKLHLTDTRAIFLMRHLVTHIFFLLCAFCGYILARRLFKDQLLACLAFIMLAFYPRIYAHSYVNSKDIPFLGIVIIAMLASQIAFEKRKPGWFALLGCCCGLATATRILGILFIGMSLVVLLWDLLRAARQRTGVRPLALSLLLFIATSCLTIYASWPILWKTPLQTFADNFSYLSHFPWVGDLLFNGTVYHSKALPWFYLPGWFAITMPAVWLATGLIGTGLVIVSFLQAPLVYTSNTTERNFVLYVVYIIAPVAAVIVLHSVVYDDWRHIYFIYPSFVMLALFALQRLQTTRLRLTANTLMTIQFVAVFLYMIRYHPFQQVYFNELVAHKEEQLRKNYDLDYWGCAYKQGMEYILAHDNSDTIRILDNILPVQNSVKMLHPEQRSRVKLVGKREHPGYIFTNFRNHPGDYPYSSVYYNIQVQNSSILRVYKLSAQEQDHLE